MMIMSEAFVVFKLFQIELPGLYIWCL